MANGPTLPPQAYTREVLSVAFQWLQNQPESIKKLAQSPDSLVGLYLRAQRYGNTAPECDAPVSSQNFISDLKNLADGLKQFDETRNATTTPPKPVIKAAPPSPLQTALEQVIAQSAQNQAKQQPLVAVQQTLTPQTPLNPAPVTSTPSAVASENSPISALNSGSQAMIREVKERLNLSSESEVLNMMVAIAYKKLKDLLA